MTSITEQRPTLIDVEKLKPYPLNAKKHSDEQVSRLANSIKRFGWRGNPIIVDKDFVIIAGHGRRLASIKLGLKQVPVIIESDMTAEEARAFRLADNRAAVSDIDNDILREELIDLGPDLLADIFDKKELDFAITDILSMNSDVFVDDLDSVMNDQQAVTDALIAKSEEKRMSVAKVLGFKDFAGSDAIHVSRFMAFVEARTGKQGAEALVEFAKEQVSK
ncbi:ParB N-terminal domain-containing protein [Methyloversatilis sp.]|uniref:ParB N-terminal domain-containing protein n=1 Tax=Methyloversatilis sp. TaxID=2569862 RepID=UPI0035B13696